MLLPLALRFSFLIRHHACSVFRAVRVFSAFSVSYFRVCELGVVLRFKKRDGGFGPSKIQARTSAPYRNSNQQ